MSDQIIYLYRPRKRDICVALADVFWQMRPTSLLQHGFKDVQTIAFRNATPEEVAEFKLAARVSWWRYSHWSNLIQDERKLAGDEWSDRLCEMVKGLIPEHATREIVFPEPDQITIK